MDKRAGKRIAVITPDYDGCLFNDLKYTLELDPLVERNTNEIGGWRRKHHGWCFQKDERKKQKKKKKSYLQLFGSCIRFQWVLSHFMDGTVAVPLYTTRALSSEMGVTIRINDLTCSLDLN